ncbi:hypothetical protein E4U52_006455 [Claviceps spartinae]|nr:hypothetical protein E4U52_006455 [Claviceps spartinae]
MVSIPHPDSLDFYISAHSAYFTTNFAGLLWAAMSRPFMANSLLKNLFYILMYFVNATLPPFRFRTRNLSSRLSTIGMIGSKPFSNSLKARASGLISKVNPNNPESTADTLVQPRVATSDECNEFITKHSTPTNPATLHDAIQYQHMLYQEQVRRYKEQEVKERAIHSWMASTVLPSVHASALEMIRKDNGVTALLWLHLDNWQSGNGT